MIPRNGGTIMLYTVGYEGLNINQFLTMLEEYGIKKIIDIREFPGSRKAGFSKTALREILSKNGVEYEHIVELGCPKEIRNNYKANSSWVEYARDFMAYVKTQDNALELINEKAQEMNCALMCFEANHNRCHRSLVATEMARRYQMKVCHADVEAAKKDILDYPTLRFA